MKETRLIWAIAFLLMGLTVWRLRFGLRGDPIPQLVAISTATTFLLLVAEAQPRIAVGLASLTLVAYAVNYDHLTTGKEMVKT